MLFSGSSVACGAEPWSEISRSIADSRSLASSRCFCTDACSRCATSISFNVSWRQIRNCCTLASLFIQHYEFADEHLFGRARIDSNSLPSWPLSSVDPSARNTIIPVPEKGPLMLPPVR